MAALGELWEDDLVFDIPRAVGVEFRECWRLGLVWVNNLPSDAGESSRRSLREREARIARMRAAQQLVHGGLPANAFQACVLFDAPRPLGLRAEAAAEITGTFLGYWMASSVGDDLREALHPQPAPGVFHVGLVARRHAPDEIVDDLVHRWLVHCGDFLLGAPGGEPAEEAGNGEAATPSIRSIDELSVAKLGSSDAQTAEASIDRFIEAELDNAALTELRAEALPSAIARLGHHILDSQQLRTQWAREVEDLNRQLAVLELRPPPVPPELPPLLKRPAFKAWTLLLLLPALGFGLAVLFTASPPDWYWIAGSAALLVALGIGLYLHRRRPVSRKPVVVPDPRIELERRRALAVHMVGEPEPPESQLPAQDPAQDPTPRGCWRLTCDLEHARTEAMLASHELEELRDASRPSKGWLVRNLASAEDLQSIFEAAVHAPRQEESESGRSGPAAPIRSDGIRTRLGEALGPDGLGAVYGHGGRHFLESMREYGEKMFGRFRSMRPADLLARLSREHPGGDNGYSVFFNTLEAGAPLLWTTDPSAAMEKVLLVYSDPWGHEIAQAGKKVLGDCTVRRTLGMSEVLIMKLVRERELASAGESSAKPGNDSSRPLDPGAS